MAQTCARCSYCNPDEALFCHHDGAPLRAASADTVDPGSRPFPMPFVFPSGLSCRTFDQLALACLQNWSDAQELLKDGFLAGFLGGIGRADLAQVAREAARNPDLDRGLDQLLARLPARSVEPPRLFVEPRAINLGRLKPGTDSRIALRLRNGGMGLLYGSIDCEDGVWVSLGETPGVRQKHFQFLDHAEIAVQVVGQQLRANNKPLEARLTLQWNGGSDTVVLTADVPVKPFPEGALAGAVSPREAASKAKLNPRDAARLFESGAVATWYRDNGWTYPVQGTAASGVASVQQFFEALGLTTPPKVELDQEQIALAGRPGETLMHTLKVSTAEKRPVYARAVTDRPWLQVNGVDLEGRSATVHLAVNPVPDSPGETLNAKVIVIANGNQRFVVPVVVSVVGTRAARSGALPVARVVAAEAVATSPSPSLSRAAAPIVGVAVDEPPPYATPVEPPRRNSRRDPEDDYDRPRRRQRSEGGRARHLIPVALLALALIGTVVRDFVIAREAPKEDVGGNDSDGPLGPPALKLVFHDLPLDGALGSSGLKPAGGGPDPGQRPVRWDPTMRFGLVMADGPGPDDERKRLTFRPNGISNNTVVRIDGTETIFGEMPFRPTDGSPPPQQWPGRWVEHNRRLPGPRIGRQSVWILDAARVQITQTVEIVSGAQSNRPDTCLVRYSIQNLDGTPHRVGLRFLLDCYIGGNDGVPYLVPGSRELCTSQEDFNDPARMPDFIQALENEDLANPGTIAQIQLKVGRSAEAPSRVTLGAYPNLRLRRRDLRCNQEKTMWDVPVLSMKSLREGDSAVTLYWDVKELGPGQTREVGFAYGLGTVSGSEGQGKLALTVGGDFTPKGEFTATAYVGNPQPGQTATLTVPEGFELVEGQPTQAVPAPAAGSNTSPVTWRVRAGRSAGTFPLKAELSTGVSQTKQVRIKVKGIFGDS